MLFSNCPIAGVKFTADRVTAHSMMAWIQLWCFHCRRRTNSSAFTPELRTFSVCMRTQLACSLFICEWGSFDTSLYFSYICIRVERLEVRLLNYKLIFLTVSDEVFSLLLTKIFDWNVKIACTKIKPFGDKYSLAFFPPIIYSSQVKKEN